MMTKKEVEVWLSTLPDDANVAIGEDGLSLVCVDDNFNESDEYLEVGMTPYEQDLLNPVDE